MTDTDVTTGADGPAGKNWSAFHRAWHNGHKEYVAEAEKFNDFYLGDQWDAEAKREIESDGRPALTLNEILQVVNAVTGHYGETRADIQYKPRMGGASEPVAHVLTRLTDHILEQNAYHTFVEPRMFEDGLIEDRGYVDVRMDFTENEMGECKIRVLDPRQVAPDPDSTSNDPQDWKQVIYTKWMSLDDIEAYYGKDKRRKVKSLATTPQDTYGDLSIKYQGFGTEQSHREHTDNDVKAVRVIERQYRKMTRARELVDVTTGKTRIIPDHWSDERAHRVAAQYGMRINTRVRSRIRWTVSADHVTLHDEWSPYSEFTIVPYFPIYRRGRPSGIVRHLIDPQMQLNKIESQILHTINTTANSGWVVESGSLVNMDHHELERRGAESGLVLVHARNRQPPQKIQPNQIPTGLENFAHKAGDYIHNIPGASALLGQQPSTNVSGVALDRAQGKALLGLQVVFNNLDFTRRLVAKRVLDCIQTYYTEHRVYYVTNWRDPEAPEEEVEINAEADLEASDQAANDVTVGTYEVMASSTPTRDTWEDMQFAQMLELRKAGVMIPDHHVVLNSQLAGKQAIAEQIKQLQGLGEPDEMQQQVMQLEMQKAQAEVAKIEAQVAELESRAQHNAARAQTEVAGEEREQQDMISKYKMELARLKADLEKKERDLENKTEIAQIHAGVKDGLTRYQANMRRFEGDRDRDSRLQQEQMRSNTQLEQKRMDIEGGLAEKGLQAEQALGQEAMRLMAQQNQPRRDLSDAAGQRAER